MITSKKTNQIEFHTTCEFCETNGFPFPSFNELTYARSTFQPDLDEDAFKKKALDRYMWDLHRLNWVVHPDNQYNIKCPVCVAWEVINRYSASTTASMLMRLEIPLQMQISDFLFGRIETKWNRNKHFPR